MATAIRLKDLARAFPHGFAAPTRDQIEDRVRHARRVMREARHTAEDLAGDASVAIRRQPLAAVAAATGAGLVLGAAFVGVAALTLRVVRGRCAE